MDVYFDILPFMQICPTFTGVTCCTGRAFTHECKSPIWNTCEIHHRHDAQCFMIYVPVKWEALKRLEWEFHFLSFPWSNVLPLRSAASQFSHNHKSYDVTWHFVFRLNLGLFILYLLTSSCVSRIHNPVTLSNIDKMQNTCYKKLLQGNNCHRNERLLMADPSTGRSSIAYCCQLDWISARPNSLRYICFVMPTLCVMVPPFCLWIQHYGPSVQLLKIHRLIRQCFIPWAGMVNLKVKNIHYCTTLVHKALRLI
jgi:hypothetical protein